MCSVCVLRGGCFYIGVACVYHVPRNPKTFLLGRFCKNNSNSLLLQTHLIYCPLKLHFLRSQTMLLSSQFGLHALYECMCVCNRDNSYCVIVTITHTYSLLLQKHIIHCPLKLHFYDHTLCYSQAS